MFCRVIKRSIENGKLWNVDLDRNTWSDINVQEVDRVAVIIYGLIVFTPLVLAALFGTPDMSKLNAFGKLGLLALGAFVALAPRVWTWYETLAFHEWINHKQASASNVVNIDYEKELFTPFSL
jgi:hypothetical protein